MGNLNQTQKFFPMTNHYTLNWRAWIMEMVGTFALCYVGGLASGTLVNVALAHGLVLGIMIYAGAAVSGANYNPAVSLGLAITGNLHFCDMGFYFLFQFIGAFLAGLLTSWYQGGPGCPPGWQGETFQGYSFCGAIMEMNAAFFLVLAVFGTAVDKRAAPGVFGLCIGGSLTMSILGIGRKTGAALNPWRFFGPAIAGLLFRWSFPATWWIYLFPFLGGAGAACLYHFCFYEKPEPEVVEVELVDAEIKI